MSMNVPIMLSDQVSEEARSVLASLITQIINFVRTLIAYVMEIIRRFTQWAGEHPLATLLFITNFAILIA